ncbi:hypothetical protein [Ruegeria arenilitoris]|uniref:hypothetical protein n=1 Tax=Ruegeria arenilitoris TaxID=1173585 RepID=UPI00147D63AF|nr:hypothetical protein [Ruegeria arenilitoris]
MVRPLDPVAVPEPDLALVWQAIAIFVMLAQAIRAQQTLFGPMPFEIAQASLRQVVARNTFGQRAYATRLMLRFRVHAVLGRLIYVIVVVRNGILFVFVTEMLHGDAKKRNCRKPAEDIFDISSPRLRR